MSKQPTFKVAAVRVRKLADGDGTPAPTPTTTASEPMTADVLPTSGGTGVRETMRRAR